MCTSLLFFSQYLGFPKHVRRGIPCRIQSLPLRLVSQTKTHQLPPLHCFNKTTCFTDKHSSVVNITLQLLPLLFDDEQLLQRVS